MARSRSISVVSFATFQAVLMAHVGLGAGILYSFGGLIYDVVTTGSVNLDASGDRAGLVTFCSCMVRWSASCQQTKPAAYLADRSRIDHGVLV